MMKHHTLAEAIEQIDGYHDYPECRANASLNITGEPWFVATADGENYCWDNAPAVGELRAAGYGAIVHDSAPDSDTVDEADIAGDFMDAARAICDQEESEYDAEEIERRIDHICDQIDWDTQKVVRTYPRDFANEFDVQCVDVDEPHEGFDVLTEDELRSFLTRWFSSGEDYYGYGDMLYSLDTYST